MEHELINRLSKVQIADLDDLVGETIIEVLSVGEVYLSTESGKWAKVVRDEEDTDETGICLADEGASYFDVEPLYRMGVVSQQEKADWDRFYEGVRQKVEEGARERRLENLRTLVTEFPEEAKGYLEARDENENL